MLSAQEILKATKGKMINGDLDKIITSYKIDSREVNQNDFYIPIIGEKVNGHRFIIDTVKKGCIGFFINEYELKNIDLNEIININKEVIIISVEDTLNALYNIGLYNRKKFSNIEAIAITGSVGKTSTREMVASVLTGKNNILVTQKNMNGHIGLPLMSLLLENQDMAILEAGIDFVGEMDLLGNIITPEVAVITNIGTSHIGKFGNKNIIYQEKTKIADSLIGKKILLLNADDEYLKEYKNDKVNIIYYSINDVEDIVIHEDWIEFNIDIYGNKEHIVINAIGNHNILNAIVAIRIGEIYKLPKEKIIDGVNKYRNFSRRMERINLGNITIIDDTYNASPSSTESGLISVDHFNDKRKIAVLADILELGDYSSKLHAELGTVFAKLDYDIVIAYGEYMKYLVDIAREYVREIYYFKDAVEAENKIREIMKDNDIIYFKGSNAMNVNKIIENLKRDFMN